MNISRCTDVALIRTTFTHPKVYRHISDDGTVDAEDFTPHLSDSMFYLAAQEAQFMGLFLYHPHNAVCYEVHTCLLPIAWGDKAIECARASLVWMFENTPCQRVITNVPTYNRLAARLAKEVGMKQFGLNEMSFLKNGILHDQLMFGLNKEQSCQQQR